MRIDIWMFQGKTDFSALVYRIVRLVMETFSNEEMSS
jgi:hypothetical protein